MKRFARCGPRLFALAVPGLLALAAPAAHAKPRDPLVHTYSIVARDPATGELGVAVQSHYFSVGPIVPWAEAGIGAVATQSLVLVDYGPNGLNLMRRGVSAPAALRQLVARDGAREGRQVAMIDARGNVDAYTGPNCIPAAGHHVGKNYSVQANLMSNDRVWPAMAAAFETAKGDLAERMMQALEAGERAGGDIRGKQSAAMVIVKAKSSGKPWADRVIDLRVEDHKDPLGELRRLIKLRRAYNHEDAGDAAISAKRPEEALHHYEEAMKLAPDVVELEFWAAVSMYTNDRVPEALAHFRRVFQRERRWVELIPRLATAGLFPNDPAKIAEVQSQAPGGRGPNPGTPPGSRVTNDLTGTRWVPVRIGNAAVVVGERQREAWISLDARAKRMSGSGGCNRISGPYEGRDGTLVFGPIVSTKMACAAMDTETAFLRALEATRRYRIAGRTLELLDDRSRPLARLEERNLR